MSNPATPQTRSVDSRAVRPLTFLPHRRDWLRASTAAAVAGLGFFQQTAAQESRSPNERLNIACIGVYNRAAANIDGVASQNIVALCDIDDHYLAGIAKRFPQANKYNDFRLLLDREKQLDAVVVSTPDHTHAPAAVWAMRQGLHCYCEKPLTHSVHEARVVANTAKTHPVATQMGTQIHASDNYRRVVEIVQAGVLGPVREVHAWVANHWGGGERPTEPKETPANLHWDLWLGPAPRRDYHSDYLPINWRRWWDFGGGTLGDMGCHYIDLPFWALKLRYPTAIEAEGPPPHAETCPIGLIVQWEFPARESLPPVKLIWYDGDRAPKEVAGRAVPGAGVMFVGDKGQLFANYGSYKLYPESQFQDFMPPPATLPNSIGHYAEWVKACREGTPTTCNFDYAGALTECVLLGNVAYRTGQRLEWDADKLLATNAPEATNFLRREYRDGWTL